ncbi:MAG: hypothetical protein JWM10_3487 [Myxococcaceae bacterium]|nr:hypothetical protein [Myxococcaceae bacterium]
MLRPMRRALLLSLLCAACASRKPAGDGGASIFIDATGAVELGWRIRVLLGPPRALTPGAGFAVRAENAAGQVFERTTGADGVVALGVAQADGPWDVTVARAGCLAVSILGLTGDFDGNVHSECGPPEPLPREHAHTLFIGVAGFPELALANAPTLCLPGFLQGDTPDRVRVDFEHRPGVPPGELWAVQFETMARGARPLNIARFPAPPLPDRDVTATIALPDPPVPVVRSRVTVEFPTEGLLTARSAGQTGGSASVYRLVPFNGDLHTCPVGRALWTAPDAAGHGTLTIDAFAAPFAPEAASVAFDDAPDAAVSGGVQVRDLTDGAVVRLAPVRALRVNAASPAGVSFSVDAPGYSSASFRAFVTAPNIHGAWVGYAAPGASLDGRRLPHLPTGISRSDLTYGFGQSDVFAATVCVASRRPGSRAPWAPASDDPDVTVCSTPSAPLPR